MLYYQLYLNWKEYRITKQSLGFSQDPSRDPDLDLLCRKPTLTEALTPTLGWMGIKWVCRWTAPSIPIPAVQFPTYLMLNKQDLEKHKQEEEVAAGGEYGVLTSLPACLTPAPSGKTWWLRVGRLPDGHHEYSSNCWRACGWGPQGAWEEAEFWGKRTSALKQSHTCSHCLGG